MLIVHSNLFYIYQTCNFLSFCLFFFAITERWYMREGWLKVVLPKGAEAKPYMFFLFSDMLLQAKRCSPLHPTSADKFTGQHAYPLQDCIVEKVFGHTKSQGGLLSVSVTYLIYLHSVNTHAFTSLTSLSNALVRDSGIRFSVSAQK